MVDRSSEPLGQPSLPRANPPPRPQGVTVMMVLCVLGGLAGLGNGCLSGVGLVISEVTPILFGGDAANPQLRLQEELRDVNRRYLIPNIALTLVGMVLSGFLLAGGFGLLKAKPWSLTLLRRIFVALIPLEIARVILGVVVQTNTVSVMRRGLDDAAVESGGPNIAEFTTLLMWVGVAVWGVWSLVKISVFIWGFFYTKSTSATGYISAANVTATDQAVGGT